MRSVMNAQQMRDVDKYMIDTLQIPGVVLMENAAYGTARLIMDNAKPGSVVHVFCGTGNNGGDGLACARILLAHDYDAYVVIVGDPDRLSPDAAANYAMFRHFDNRTLRFRRIDDLYNWRVPKADVIVDALFGTGLSRDVSGIHEEVIGAINNSRALKVAVDIPSGISADNGRILGSAVKADHTVTFQYPKLGHYLFPGREYTGRLTVVPIGFDEGVEKVVDSQIMVVESDDPDMKLAARPLDSNKGTYGKLLLIAGSRGMAGAAVMSARAAYAAGAGLVDVAAPQSVIDVLQITEPEAICTVLPDEDGHLYGGSRVEIAKAMYKKSALAIGPGLGEGEGIKDIVTDVVDDDSLCRIIDADALNALDGDLHILAHMKGDLIFTPHPLEFARLIGTEVDGVLEHPLELATAFAKKCGIVLVLKGATTIIADKDGSVTLVAAGSPGMSKGGSGDVLTGAIGGFVAQGFSAHDSAVLGAYYCAMAGERAAKSKGEYSMTPADTIAELGAVMETTTKDPMAWRPMRKPSAAFDAPRSYIPSTRSRQITEPAVSDAQFVVPESLATSKPAAHPAEQPETQMDKAVTAVHAPAETTPVSAGTKQAERPRKTREERRLEREAQKAEETAPAPVSNVSHRETARYENARPVASSPTVAMPETKAREQAETIGEAEKRYIASERAESVRTSSPAPKTTEETRRSVGTSSETKQQTSGEERPRSRAEAARRAADTANEVAAKLRGSTRETGSIAEQLAASHTAPVRPVSQHTSQHTTRIVPAAPLSHEQPRTSESKTAAKPASPAVSQRTEAQKKRDDLNAQIQNELKKQEKEKPVARTRRRIG